MTPLLELKDLQKSFGGLAVTDGVCLAIRPGECHALIGPNGAGKTTLVHQIAGHHFPDAGAILFDGEDITRHSMARRARLGIARSFQITSILPDTSVLENVALAVQARSGSSFSFARPVAKETKLNAEAAAVLATVGLGARAGERAGELSHGEKRQLELAIAIAMLPKLMLLDEPMAGAGKEDTLRLIEILKALKGRYTMLLVEHDMDAVFALADRVSVLVYGRILATGTAVEIRANEEVRAAYLGEESPA
jgi:branched-chain amino acid transport system ATP-binding protein